MMFSGLGIERSTNSLGDKGGAFAVRDSSAKTLEDFLIEFDAQGHLS